MIAPRDEARALLIDYARRVADGSGVDRDWQLRKARTFERIAAWYRERGDEASAYEAEETAREANGAAVLIRE